MVILLVIVALINVFNEASKKMSGNFKSLVGIPVEQVSAGFSMLFLVYRYFDPANKIKLNISVSKRK
jgi:hypothetical protein